MAPDLVTQDNNKPLIPREVLFSPPDMFKVKLSPDGDYISYIAPKNGVLNLFIAPFDKPIEALGITDDSDRGLFDYEWTYNNDIIFEIDTKGDENFKLYRYNLDTKVTKLLTPEFGVQASILKLSSDHPEEALILLNDRDPKYHDVYKINLETGELKLVIENNQYSAFIADNNLNVRFAKFFNNNSEIEYFEYINNKFLPFLTIPFENTYNTRLDKLDKSGENLYILDSRGSNTSALKVMNLKTREMSILAQSINADLDIFTTNPITGIVEAVDEYYEKSHPKILDNRIKEDLDYLMQLENGELSINSRTLDDKKWLVVYTNDSCPIKYYYYDRLAHHASYISSHIKELESYELHKMNPVIIKARDGLDLVSYLTLPNFERIGVGLEVDHPIPMILYVHGGPWLREKWGFHLLHQWFADRGYAVLDINFRGSKGFGSEFSKKGNFEWGKKMHDDLIDGVNWAIDHHIANPDKICIYGGSYGGYATLCGLTLTPDIFACGVELVGISNLVTFMKSFPPYWKPNLANFKHRVGDHETEEGVAALLDVSPITHIDKMKVPLLFAQGKNDVRVKETESNQIYESMVNRNIPVLYLNFEGEGHGFKKPSNQKAFRAITEEFLSNILGGKLEPLESKDFEGAEFTINKFINNADIAFVGEVIQDLIEAQCQYHNTNS